MLSQQFPHFKALADRRASLPAGSASIKLTLSDHTGRDVRVLTVSTPGAGEPVMLCQEDLKLLLARQAPIEDLSAYLARSAFILGGPIAGPEALLHAALPAAHVDITRPDAVLALACAPEHVQQMTGAAFIPYAPPGLALARQLQALDIKALDCIIVGKLGLITWGKDAKACQEATRRAIKAAKSAIKEQRAPAHFLGRVTTPPLDADTRCQAMLDILPMLRGALGGGCILTYDQSDAALDAVGRAGAAGLADQGAVCLAHVAHAGRVPLYIDYAPDAPLTFDVLSVLMNDYAKEHNSTPRVMLLPGLGIVTAGADIGAARQAQTDYRQTLRVLATASPLGGCTGLTPEEAKGFSRSLEAVSEFGGSIALVTGAANGIGRATAARLAEAGAHVLVADIDRKGGESITAEINRRFGEGRAIFVHTDVTDEAAVIAAIERAVLTYGGLDVLVNNAGIALAAPIEETTLAMWRRCSDILGLGYFLMAREAVKVMKAQGVGGAMVFVGSKNSIAPTPNATAYAAAKGSELQIARSLAEEVGAHRIRVNSVLPDAVLRGSRIWDNATWTKERAASHGVDIDELEQFYVERTTLKVPIYPEDVAEAIAFLAGPHSTKTTGAVLTVDGGVAIAYVR